MGMSFPLGMFNRRKVFQNEPEATVTRHRECANSLWVFALNGSFYVFYVT